jgi:hypothetical protein
VQVGSVDDVAGDDEVVPNELGRIGVVGMDAANLGRGQVDLVRAFLREEVPHLGG